MLIRDRHAAPADASLPEDRASRVLMAVAMPRSFPRSHVSARERRGFDRHLSMLCRETEEGGPLPSVRPAEAVSGESMAELIRHAQRKDRIGAEVVVDCDGNSEQAMAWR